MSGFVKKSIKSVLRSMGYNLRKTDQPFDFEAFLYLCANKKGVLFFIQIGACDGVSFDPIYQFVSCNPKHTKGIVVEPVEDNFRALQLNYEKYPHIIPVRAAIHNVEKEMTLYRVDPSKIKDSGKWMRGIASFNKDHHKLSGTPSELMIGEKVRCMSFSSLLKDHQIEEIDLLQMDTEGYDAEIILSIDFNSIKPKIIRFEHGLPDGIMSETKFQMIVNLLHRNGYELALEFYDATTYQPSIISDSFRGTLPQTGTAVQF